MLVTIRLGGEGHKPSLVELGFETGDRVEIVGTASADINISAGQMVVIIGAPALSDGAKIRLMNDEEGSPESTEQAG